MAPAKKRKPRGQCRSEAEFFIGQSHTNDVLRCILTARHHGPHCFTVAFEPTVLARMEQIATRLDWIQKSVHAIHGHVQSMHNHMHQEDNTGIELPTNPPPVKDKPS